MKNWLLYCKQIASAITGAVHYVDVRGMGVRNKIVPLMLKDNGVRPDFEATEDHANLILPRFAKSP